MDSLLPQVAEKTELRVLVYNGDADPSINRWPELQKWEQQQKK